MIRDLTGQTFGSLTAIKLDHIGNNRQAFWLFRCVCGKEKVLRSNTVAYCAKQYKNSKPQFPSCGCKELEQKTKHGYRKAKDTHPTYKVWRSILDRCYDKNNPAYKWYGAVGVTMCDEWKDNPKAFCDWAISHGWSEGKHIDKDILCEKLNIHPHIYSPETCQFVSAKENVGFATNRNNYGKHPNVKLSNEQVKEILKLHEEHPEISGPKMAKRYGVANSTIYRIYSLRH